MKNCPKCGEQLQDNAVFCTRCGEKQQDSAGAQTNQSYQQNYAPGGYNKPYDPYDHTAEFDAKDISDNKVISMLAYLLGTFGLIIALLAAKDSPYASFHVRQALKFTVVNALMAIVTLFLCWTVIVPIVAGIAFAVLAVIKIISFFQICIGKAVEPYIIRNLGFLR